MTQISRPQADTQATYVSPPSDPGPYTADQWAELFQVLFTGDQEATQGPLIQYANQLIATNTTPTLTIGTGAAFCYGHWFINDALVTFNPSDADRKDRVVLVNNNTNAVYNTNLEFPTVPGVDYDAGPVAIAEYSCRLAILTGTGVGAARALVNAAGINMIELHNYEITAAAGVITDLTDARDFCKFSTFVIPDMIANRTRKFFVVPISGASMTVKGQSLIDGGVRTAWGQFMVPSDFASGMTVTAAVYSDAVGNLYVSNTAEYGACGEAHAAHTDTVAIAAVGVTIVRNCIVAITLTNEAAGDLVSLTFIRDATDPLDTTDDDAYLYGWIVEYTADS